MRNKILISFIIIAVFFLIPNVSYAQQMIISNPQENIVKTGDVVWKIHKSFLSEFIDISLKPYNDSCIYVYLKPKKTITDLWNDRNMGILSLLNKHGKKLQKIYNYAQEKGINLINSIRSFNKFPIRKLKGFHILNVKKGDFSSLDITNENSLLVCSDDNFKKGDLISLGFGTTNITIENSTFQITLDPETEYCLTDCEHEILITNKDSESHQISIDNITIENPSEMGNIKIYRKFQEIDHDYDTPNYVLQTVYYENISGSVCQEENNTCEQYNDTYCSCEEYVYDGVIPSSVYKTVYEEFNDYLISPDETITLVLRYSVPINSTGKYNITFFFNGEYYNIDPFWNSSWQYRKQINITNNNQTEDMPIGQVVHFIMDTTGENFRDDGKDIRIVYNDTEIDRINISDFNSTSTRIYFALQNPIPAGSYDDNYYVYYGNPNADNPKQNKSNIFNFTQDFDNGINWEYWCNNRTACGMCWNNNSGFMRGSYCSSAGSDFVTSDYLRWYNMTERIYKFRYYSTFSSNRGAIHKVLNDLYVQSRFSPNGDYVCVHCGSADNNSAYYVIDFNKWYWVDIVRGGWNVPIRYYVDWNLVIENDSSTYAGRLGSGGRFGFNIGESTDLKMDVDEIYIFNYFYPDPTITLSGQEENIITPNIIFVFPTPDNASTISTNSVTINITDSNQNTLDTCILSWNGTNYTMMTEGTYCHITLSSLQNGNYVYRVYANNTGYSELSSSEERYLSVNYQEITGRYIDYLPQPFNFIAIIILGLGYLMFLLELFSEEITSEKIIIIIISAIILFAFITTLL